MKSKELALSLSVLPSASADDLETSKPVTNDAMLSAAVSTSLIHYEFPACGLATSFSLNTEPSHSLCPSNTFLRLMKLTSCLTATLAYTPSSDSINLCSFFCRSSVQNGQRTSSRSDRPWLLLKLALSCTMRG